MSSVLICGVSGQDGAYLARHLIRNGKQVIGTSRNVGGASTTNLDLLGISNDVDIIPLSPTRYEHVLQAIKELHPSEVYNLSGQSSVAKSFEHPVETIMSISIATANFLQAIRRISPETKYYNACSGECFGDTGNSRSNEETPFRPSSPYAIAKEPPEFRIR